MSSRKVHVSFNVDIEIEYNDKSVKLRDSEEMKEHIELELLDLTGIGVNKTDVHVTNLKIKEV